MLHGEKILITGPAGRIGSGLAKTLAPHNEVWGIARFRDEATRERVESLGVTTRVADLGAGRLDDLPTDFNYLLQLAGKPFTIIHGLDGYDEISLTNDTKVITNEGEKIMTPEQLGKRTVAASDIQGGKTVEEAAKIFSTIIKGEGNWAQNAVVLANASMALYCTGKYTTYNDAYHAAVESLESGKAYASLQKLIALQ